MQNEIFVLVCAVFLGAVAPAQLPPIRVYIAGHVTVTTSESLRHTSITVRTERVFRDEIPSSEREFVFCIAHPEPIASKLNYKGGARIVYHATRNRTSMSTTAGPEQYYRRLPFCKATESRGFSLRRANPTHTRQTSGVLDASRRSEA